MKIFLIGMPGTGKSRVGRALAGHLKVPFFDLDHEIVKNTGKDIPVIFREHGENWFREKERDVLHAVVRSNMEFVLATGGGAPCFFDNMDFMNINGITVFLHIPLKDLYNRLLSGGTRERPLLKDKSPEALLRELQQRYDERIPFYRRAKLEVNSSYGVIEKRVLEIVRLLPG